MTFAINEQIKVNKRTYFVESLTIKNGQVYADATYRLDWASHQVVDDDIRIMLAKKVRN